jgi:hypothetical protein
VPGRDVKLEGKHVNIVFELRGGGDKCALRKTARYENIMITCHGKWPSVPPTRMKLFFKPTAAA